MYFALEDFGTGSNQWDQNFEESWKKHNTCHAISAHRVNFCSQSGNETSWKLFFPFQKGLLLKLHVDTLAVCKLKPCCNRRPKLTAAEAVVSWTDTNSSRNISRCDEVKSYQWEVFTVHAFHTVKKRWFEEGKTTFSFLTEINFKIKEPLCRHRRVFIIFIVEKVCERERWDNRLVLQHCDSPCALWTANISVPINCIRPPVFASHDILVKFNTVISIYSTVQLAVRVFSCSPLLQRESFCALGE